MDTQIQEQLKVAKTAAEALAVDGDATVSETETTVRKVLENVVKAEQLPADDKGILEGILKLSAFEDTTAIKIKVQNDPWQQPTPTLTIGNVQTLAAARGDSAIASNLSAIGKQVEAAVVELAKLVEAGTGAFVTAVREVIAKAGPATAKLEQIRSVLAIKMEDGEDADWRMRCKVGELVSMLAQHAAIERMLESSPPPTAAEKAAGSAKDPEEQVWPADMAQAVIDPKSGNITKGELPWGRDPAGPR